MPQHTRPFMNSNFQSLSIRDHSWTVISNASAFATFHEQPFPMPHIREHSWTAISNASAFKTIHEQPFTMPQHSRPFTKSQFHCLSIRDHSWTATSNASTFATTHEQPFPVSHYCVMATSPSASGAKAKLNSLASCLRREMLHWHFMAAQKRGFSYDRISYLEPRWEKRICARRSQWKIIIFNGINELHFTF